MIDFKGSYFEWEIILCGVRWYGVYPGLAAHAESGSGRRRGFLAHGESHSGALGKDYEVLSTFRPMMRYRSISLF